MPCIFGLLFLGLAVVVVVVAIVCKGIPLGSTRTLPLTASLVLAGVLTMPMCCGFGGATGYVTVAIGKKAVEATQANQGRPLTPEQVESLQ